MGRAPGRPEHPGAGAARRQFEGAPVLLALVAGWLLLAGAAVQFVATVATMDRAGGQSVWSALGGSSGVIVLPFLVLAVMFLAVAGAERWAGDAHGGPHRLGHVH